MAKPRGWLCHYNFPYKNGGSIDLDSVIYFDLFSRYRPFMLEAQLDCAIIPKWIKELATGTTSPTTTTTTTTTTTSAPNTGAVLQNPTISNVLPSISSMNISKMKVTKKGKHGDFHQSPTFTEVPAHRRVGDVPLSPPLPASSAPGVGDLIAADQMGISVATTHSNGLLSPTMSDNVVTLVSRRRGISPLKHSKFRPVTVNFTLEQFSIIQRLVDNITVFHATRLDIALEWTWQDSAGQYSRGPGANARKREDKERRGRGCRWRRRRGGVWSCGTNTRCWVLKPVEVQLGIVVCGEVNVGRGEGELSWWKKGEEATYQNDIVLFHSSSSGVLLHRPVSQISQIAPQGNRDTSELRWTAAPPLARPAASTHWWARYGIEVPGHTCSLTPGAGEVIQPPTPCYPKRHPPPHPTRTASIIYASLRPHATLEEALAGTRGEDAPLQPQRGRELTVIGRKLSAWGNLGGWDVEIEDRVRNEGWSAPHGGANEWVEFASGRQKRLHQTAEERTAASEVARATRECKAAGLSVSWTRAERITYITAGCATRGWLGSRDTGTGRDSERRGQSCK
ncbi:hypothetical protein B0H17DRAFT_1144348 [Mycena rosella]|uniref:Uncharacterized protein n=1 Tax=Mycena rosella TaxID=1033263 RepID=A0AAD7CTD2_MYCRO|nr:hypothetical protein B0H17DRAFT_1144348 [Mycena rosella]